MEEYYQYSSTFLHLSQPADEPYCQVNSNIIIGCPPDHYPSEYPELWQNRGNGTFQEITTSAGMRPKAADGKQNMHGKAMVLAFADIDGDGLIDFYIGNDTVPADMMHNLGHLHFKNIATISGLAYGKMNHAIAAMGADWADYDRDGNLDLAVTAFSDETYSLMRNNGNLTFTQKNDETLLSGATLLRLGFGAKWLDVDNDGWEDLLFANGHVYDQAADINSGTELKEPLMLFRNLNGKVFQDIAPILGGAMLRPRLGRGLATGDIDNDGKLDFLVVDSEAEPALMHNASTCKNHWITFDLRGKTPNRFAYGAKITAIAGKQKWIGQVSPASSYLSSSDPRVHFGMGSVTMLNSVLIRWSTGEQEILKNVACDQICTVIQGKGIKGK